MKIKKGVLIQKLGDMYVAYDNEKSTLHELNEVGFLILERIERGKKKRWIIEKIVKSYKVSEKEAKRDFEDFTGLLKKKDLIVNKR